MCLLSDHGLAQLETLVDVIDDADPFGGLADYWYTFDSATLGGMASRRHLHAGLGQWRPV